MDMNEKHEAKAMRNEIRSHEMMLAPGGLVESAAFSVSGPSPEEDDGPSVVRITEFELINDILENISILDGVVQLFADFSGLGSPADFSPNGVVFNIDEDFELGGIDRVRTNGIAEISIIGTPFDDLVRIRENVVFFDGIGGFDIVTIDVEDLTSGIVIDFLTGGDQLATAGYTVRNVEGLQDIRTGSGNDTFLIGSTILDDGDVNVLEAQLGFDTILFDFSDFVFSPDRTDTQGIEVAAVGVFWFGLGDEEANDFRIDNFEEVSLIGTRYDDVFKLLRSLDSQALRPGMLRSFGIRLAHGNPSQH